MESAFEVDGPHYFTVLALHILPPEKWRATRVEILRRLLVTSQARAAAPGGAARSVPASQVPASGSRRPPPAAWTVCALCVGAAWPRARAEGGKACSLGSVVGADPSQFAPPESGPDGWQVPGCLRVWRSAPERQPGSSRGRFGGSWSGPGWQGGAPGHQLRRA